MTTINISGVTKRFLRQPVLQDINLSFRSNAITALLGPNSSGKSTLIKCILSLVIPDTGSIHVLGADITHGPRYRAQIGYMPQIARFPEHLKVKELLKMIESLREEKAQTEHLLDVFDLNKIVNKTMRTLSGGTRQKINVVLAMMFNSPILIFDEPTVGLDPIARVRFKALLAEERKSGKTILYTSHFMREVEELADEVIFLLDGKIHFNGPIQQLKEMEKEENLENAVARLLMRHNSKS